jgi:hypothetical protein
MARVYAAFLLRYWPRNTGEQRIEITHIQSGDKTVVTSLPAVLDWISAQAEQAPALVTAPRGAGARRGQRRERSNATEQA